MVLLQKIGNAGMSTEILPAVFSFVSYLPQASPLTF